MRKLFEIRYFNPLNTQHQIYKPLFGNFYRALMFCASCLQREINMPYSTKWTTLTRANKSIFVLTVFALSLLVLGFSTPLWISISVKFKTDFRSEIFEVVEKQYIGLWQWCYKHYGCFDLSFLAKLFSIYTKIISNVNKDEKLDMIVNKVNKIMSIYF